MSKTYRILICKPGGRYGQLPSERLMEWFGGKVQKFSSKEEAERTIESITGSKSYNSIPQQYRPTYKVV